MRILSSLFQRYTHRLQTKPVSTKMATSSFVFCTSDLICQFGIEKKTLQDYNYFRTIRQTLLGCPFVGPTLHVWHSYVIPTVTRPIRCKFKTIAASYAMGEGVLSPYFLSTTLFFYEYLNLFDVRKGFESVKQKFWPTLKRSFQFWGVVSLFTYSIVPVIFRPVFSTCFSLIWQVYLSYIGNMKSQLFLERQVEEETVALLESSGVALAIEGVASEGAQVSLLSKLLPAQ